MSLFGNKKTGGFMDEIRCDEPSYLIWKWHPAGAQQGSNNRENAIRWGSSLRVKDGEVAVFVYTQDNGMVQDFIEGPFDETLNTKNLPVIARIIGLAYDGGTPFQAEVYYINLARVIQIPFAVPFFDLYDPRFLDFGVPTAVRGRITFNISDYRAFIKLHRLYEFDLNSFQTQVRDAISRYVKGIVTNIPSEKNIPIVQIEREIPQINKILESTVRERFGEDFGVNISSIDINAIEIDKTSEGYRQLKSVTQDVAAATVQAQTEVNIKNIHDTQRINMENMEETLRIQREEAQYAQRKQTESSNFAAYQLEKQAEVGIAGAKALGEMGANGATGMSEGGGMNMAGMMAGMAMGGAVGQNMAGMMNNMMGGIPQQPNQPSVTPPPIIQSAYYIAVDGQPTGPYDIRTLVQMAATGSFKKDSVVWKQGMAVWVNAETVQELQSAFVSDMPPIPTTTSEK